MNRSRKGRAAFLLSALLVAMFAAGCGMVDSAEPARESHNVEEYYFNLDDGVEYYYTLIDSNRNTISLEMEMKGTNGGTFKDSRVYSCEWAYGPSAYATYYYAKCPESAYYLGMNSGAVDMSWCDLKSPIRTGATWTFLDPFFDNIPTTATIKHAGVKVMWEGKEYSDVVVVEYKNAARTVTKTFARDIGLLYGNTLYATGKEAFQKFESMSVH